MIPIPAMENSKSLRNQPSRANGGCSCRAIGGYFTNCSPCDAIGASGTFYPKVSRLRQHHPLLLHWIEANRVFRLGNRRRPRFLPVSCYFGS